MIYIIFLGICLFIVNNIFHRLRGGSIVDKKILSYKNNIVFFMMISLIFVGCQR